MAVLWKELVKNVIINYNRKELYDREIAKQTREMQVIDKWMEECNDPKEECNTDLVTAYAMPNGTKKFVRNHTW